MGVQAIDQAIFPWYWETQKCSIALGRLPRALEHLVFPNTSAKLF